MKVIEQADATPSTPAEIMSDQLFRQGFEEKRAGRQFYYDRHYDWAYERGRQFATIAPANMSLLLPNGKLNPKALALFTRELFSNGMN